MLKALGIGKKKPATPEQISKHKEQVRTQAGHQHDVDQLHGILRNLKDTYAKSKGDFALGRYEELKTMIKGSIQQYRDVVSGKKQRQHEALTAAGESKASAISRLRQNAQSFASNQDQMKQQEHDYSVLTSKEIDADLDKIRKDIINLKEEYRQLRDKFEAFAKDYEDSKRHNPTQRYGILKEMIKAISKDV